MKRLRKRVFAAVLAAFMLVTAMPETVFYASAETGDVSGNDMEQAETENMEKDCPVCGADGAGLSVCKGKDAEENAGEQKDTGICRHHQEHDANCGCRLASEEGEGSPCTYVCRICPIGDLLVSLPDQVTEDNADEVRARLDEILDLYRELNEDEQGQIDLSRCLELQEALAPANALMQAAEGRTEQTEGDEASVTIDGETLFYAALEEAFSAANGKNAAIIMLNDAECIKDSSPGAPLNITGGTVTLDMNGKTLSGKGWGSYGIVNVGGGSLSIAGSGSFTVSGYGISCKKGTLTIADTCFNLTGDTDKGFYAGAGVFNHGGTVILNGVQMTGPASDGQIYHHTGSTTINDVTATGITGQNCGSVYYHDSGTLTINGGTFDKIVVDAGNYGNVQSISELLGEDRAYRKQDGTWGTADELTALEISNVTVTPIPLKMNPQGGGSWYFGSLPPHTLAMNAVPVSDGEITYIWKNGDAELGCTTDTYEISTDMSAGSYTYTCEATCDGYTLSHEFSFKVEKSGTWFEGDIKACNGNEETTDFTVGDTITVRATPAATGSAPQRAARLRGGYTALDAGQMALFVGNVQVSDPVRAGADGTYTMTASASDILLQGNAEPNGSAITLTAKFVGNDNMADAAGTVDVNISAVAMAEIDGAVVGYYGAGNLADAFGAANSGATVTLLRDVTVSQTITIEGTGSRFTLSGGGHRITNTAGDTENGAAIEIVSGEVEISDCKIDSGRSGVDVTGGRVTINDCTINATGWTLADGMSGGNGVFVGGGEVTIKGGTCSGAGGNDAAGVNIGQNGTVIIEDGAFSGTGGVYTAGVNVSGGRVTIKAGTFTGGSNGIYNSGSADIQNGTFTGNTGIYNSGTVTVQDGAFTGTDGFGIHNAGTANLSGGTFNGSACGLYNYGGTASLTGGTYTGGQNMILSDADKPFSDMLGGDGKHYACYQGGKPLALAELGTWLDSGTVTVKECGHEGVTPTDNGGKHTLTCPCCGYSCQHDTTLTATADGTVITVHGRCEQENCGYDEDLGTVTLHIPRLVYGDLTGKISAETTLEKWWSVIVGGIGPGNDTAVLNRQPVAGYEPPAMADLTGNILLSAGTHKLNVIIMIDVNADPVVKAECELTFHVERAPLTDSMVTLDKTDVICNGTEQKPAVTVKQGQTTLAVGTDYTVSYTRDGVVTNDFTNAGKVTVTVNGQGNYEGEVEKTFTIKQAEPNVGTVTAGTLENTLDVSQVVLNRTNQTTAGTLTLTDSILKYGTNTYTWKFTPDSTNYKTVTGDVQITVNDTIPPAAEYRLGTDGWKKFINTVSFGVFCRDYRTVTIKGTDDTDTVTGSGISLIQYYISDQEITDTDSIVWSTYTEPVSLDVEGTYLIYVKVTDNAGNTAVLNSEGIVVYAESTLSPAAFDYTYRENGDRTIQLAMNGNTFKEFTDQEGNAVDTANYSIDSNGTLILKAAYLDTLDQGGYTYTVSVNPQGIETDQVTLAYTFIVNVKAKELTVTGAEAAGRDYDGTNAVKITAVTLSGMAPEDEVAVDLSGIQGTLSSANAGTYTAVTLPQLTLTGADSGNYTLVQPETAVPTSVKITPLSAEIVLGTDTYSKTFGDAAFTLDVTDNNTEADVQYEVTKGADVVSVENGTVTIRNAGTAEIRVSLPASANYTAAAGKTITVTVDKKSGYTAAALNRSYYYRDGGADSIDLAALLPADCGNVAYGEPSVSGNVTYSAAPAVSGGKLSYTLDSGNVNEEGTITVTVTTRNYADITITVNVKLTDRISVSLKAGTEVTLKNNILTYGEPLSDLAFNEAEFVTADGKTVTGVLAWKEAAATPDAGTAGAVWIFTPAEGKYASLEGTAAITVNRAAPAVSAVPTVADRIYNPSVTLKADDLSGGKVTGVDGKELAGGWGWQGADIVPAVNNSGYAAVFTPADTTNYETASGTVTVNVTKATPYVAVLPTAAGITYGETLKDSALSGGTVQYGNGAGQAGDSAGATGTASGVTGTASGSTGTASGSTGTAAGNTGAASGNTGTVDGSTAAVAGTFTWKEPAIKPVVSDSSVTGYTVVFTPSDTENYHSVETKVTLTVNKAQNAPNMPGSTMDVPNSIEKAGDAPLPEGWEWQASDRDTALEAGKPVSALAVYTGADKGNYEKETVTVAITRSDCDHVAGDILYTGAGEKEPACRSDGLGHRECTRCGALMETGIVVRALGHTGGTATCSRRAVCTRCGQPYGDTDGSVHGNTEVRGITEATCTAGGYTGDICCMDCGARMKTGSATPALGHNYTGTVTKEPTTGSEGIRTYTCTRCGHSYTEGIPKLPGDGTTEPGIPFIKGEDGKIGWDVIRAEEEQAGEGSVINVDMNGTTVVPGNIFDGIKGRDITVTFDMGSGILWSVDGKSIIRDMSPEQAGDIDFAVRTGVNAVPVDIVNHVAGESYSIQLSLAYEGEFGLTAVLSINLGKENAGYTASLYYYNKSAGKLEFICADTITEDGTASIAFTHASDYVIAIDTDEEETGDDAESAQPEGTEGTDRNNVTGAESPRTGQAWIPGWFMVIGALVITVGIGIFPAAKTGRKGRRKGDSGRL